MSKENQAPFPKPFPLFSTYEVVKGLTSLQPYPDEIPFIKASVDSINNKINGVDFEYGLAIEFINWYGRKSKATFNNFRSETENFLLYSWLVKGKKIKDMSFDDINEYIDFYMKPSIEWINTRQTPHFILPGSKRSESGQYLEGDMVQNKTWRPFRVKSEDFKSRAKFIKRHVSQSSLNSMFSILSLLFAFLTIKKYANGDPISAVKKFSPYLIKNDEPPIIRTFSEYEWDLIKEILVNEADINPDYERNLFAIITMKSLYLRVSELSDRDNWSPIMSDFNLDVKLDNGETGSLLKVLGKGNKLRTVSVSDEYLNTYLRRYRNYRGLSDKPTKYDKEPILHRLTGGNKGLSVQQVSRIVNEGLQIVVERLLERDDYKGNIDTFISATTHWLRHTGASHDISTRPIKHIADDLGHKDMATTDRNYVQASYSERIRSGTTRKV